MAGWLRRILVGGEPEAAVTGHALDAPAPARVFGVDVPAEMLEAMTGGGAIAPRVARDVALQVPAVLRARNLICTPATLPLRYVAPDRSTQTWPLFEQIDPDVPNSVVWAQTYEDLLFEGIAWWKVTSFGWHGYPINATHVPVQAVHVAGVGGVPSEVQISPDQPWPVDGQVYIDGLPVGDREVIRFDSPNPPLLTHAARAIRTCLKLDQATALYADDPLPLGYFAPRENAEIGTREEIQDVLDEWEQARSERAWGYVGAALEAKALQWDPEKLQLAEARQHAVLEIARAVGVDPEDLGVSTTSRTYQNSEQRRLDLIDFTLGTWVSAVQDRLSMGDVTPRGYKARVDFGGFLRGDTKTRMETYKIGREVGAYTDDEVREAEDKPALTSAQRAAVANRATAPREPATREPQMTADPLAGAQFTDDGMHVVTFDQDDVYETFRVNPEKRTISGLLVPWGAVARSGFAKWRFAKGSLHWSNEARIKLNRHHDRTQLVARAIRLQDVPAGLDGSFKVARGDEGDRALSLAEDGVLDGFSIEIDFEDGDEWQVDPQDEGVRLVRSATLRGVALTGTPAFDDARVASVAADRSMIGNPDDSQVRGRTDHDEADEGGRQQRSGARVRVRSRLVRVRPG